MTRIEVVLLGSLVAVVGLVLLVRFLVAGRKRAAALATAAALGLDVEPGKRPHLGLRGFELTHDEYQVEVLDRMHGLYEGVLIEVLDCCCHPSAHSADPPKLVTVLAHEATEPGLAESVVAAAPRFGFRGESKGSGRLILYRPERVEPVTERERFLAEAMRVLRAGGVGTLSP